MKKLNILTWFLIISSMLYVVLFGILVWLVIVLVNAEPQDRDNWGEGVSNDVYNLCSIE